MRLAYSFDSVGNERPDPKDLQRYVINRYAEHWYSIGVELGIKTAAIEKDEHECKDRLRKILEMWLNSINASWKTLEVAITNVLRAQQCLDPVDDIYGIVFNYSIHEVLVLTF